MTGITGSGPNDNVPPPPSGAPLLTRTASTYGRQVLQERYDDVLTIAREHLIQCPGDRERVRDNLGELARSDWLCREEIGQLFYRALFRSEALSETMRRVLADEEN